MPTPTETLQAVRSAADVNAEALESVQAQVAVQLLEVEGWPASPSKGYMRDQLRRLKACYHRSRECAVTTSEIATRVLALLGSDPGPGPAPPPNTWSTGDW